MQLKCSSNLLNVLLQICSARVIVFTQYNFGVYKCMAQLAEQDPGPPADLQRLEPPVTLRVTVLTQQCSACRSLLNRSQALPQMFNAW